MIKFHRPNFLIAPPDTPPAKRTLLQKIFHKAKDDLSPAERRTIQMYADKSSRKKLFGGLISIKRKKPDLQSLTTTTVEKLRALADRMRGLAEQNPKRNQVANEVVNVFSSATKNGIDLSKVLSNDEITYLTHVMEMARKPESLHNRYFSHLPPELGWPLGLKATDGNVPVSPASKKRPDMTTELPSVVASPATIDSIQPNHRAAEAVQLIEEMSAENPAYTGIESDAPGNWLEDTGISIAANVSDPSPLKSPTKLPGDTTQVSQVNSLLARMNVPTTPIGEIGDTIFEEKEESHDGFDQEMQTGIHPNQDTSPQRDDEIEHIDTATLPTSRNEVGVNNQQDQKKINKSSADASRARAMLFIEPEYARGWKPHLFKNKEWRSLKNDLKRTYIRVQWQHFLNGIKPENGTEELKKSMMETLASKTISENLKEKANKYIQYRTGKQQYGYDQKYGTTSSSYWTKGTTLESPIIRTKNGNFFREVKTITPELRQRIKQQQGKDYRGITILGEGAFGTVKIAEHLDEKNSTVVAAKLSAEKDILFNESKMLDKMPANSRHFTTVRDFALAPKKGKSKHKAILFLDIEIRGNMTSVMHKIKASDRVRNREKLQRTLARQFVECVKEMHDHGVYHRDIKPDNFLFSKDGTVVIADFGTASTQDEQNETGELFGTEGYWAPEAMKPHAKKSEGDKFSLGQVLNDLCQTVEKVVTPSTGSTDSIDSLFEIVQLLAHSDPGKRPSLDTILESPYFQGEVYTDDELRDVIDSL